MVGIIITVPFVLHLTDIVRIIDRNYLCGNLSTFKMLTGPTLNLCSTLFGHEAKSICGIGLCLCVQLCKKKESDKNFDRLSFYSDEINGMFD